MCCLHICNNVYGTLLKNNNICSWICCWLQRSINIFNLHSNMEIIPDLSKLCFSHLSKLIFPFMNVKLGVMDLYIYANMPYFYHLNEQFYCIYNLIWFYLILVYPCQAFRFIYTREENLLYNHYNFTSAIHNFSFQISISIESFDHKNINVIRLLRCISFTTWWDRHAGCRYQH